MEPTISLQPFERRHLEKTLVWANDPDFSRLLDRAWFISDYEHEQWFLKLHQKKDSLNYFAIEIDTTGDHIGNIWLWNIDWRHRKAEISILIGESSFHGKGLGTKAIEMITLFAFEKLNLHKVYAHVLAINPRAKRAFEKAGLDVEGQLKADRWTCDQYSDVFILAKINP